MSAVPVETALAAEECRLRSLQVELYAALSAPPPDLDPRDRELAARTWSACVAAVPGRPQGMVYAPRRDGGWEQHPTPDRDVPAELPAEPTAPYVYDSAGRARWLLLNLVPGRDGREQVLRDATYLAALLTLADVPWFACRGANGGVHLYGRLDAAYDRTSLSPLVQRLTRSKVVPTLRRGPLDNVRTGSLTLPGSPDNSTAEEGVYRVLLVPEQQLHAALATQPEQGRLLRLLAVVEHLVPPEPAPVYVPPVLAEPVVRSVPTTYPQLSVQAQQPSILVPELYFLIHGGWSEMQRLQQEEGFPFFYGMPGWDELPPRSLQRWRWPREAVETWLREHPRPRHDREAGYRRWAAVQARREPRHDEADLRRWAEQDCDDPHCVRWPGELTRLPREEEAADLTPPDVADLVRRDLVGLTRLCRRRRFPLPFLDPERDGRATFFPRWYIDEVTAWLRGFPEFDHAGIADAPAEWVGAWLNQRRAAPDQERSAS